MARFGSLKGFRDWLYWLVVFPQRFTSLCAALAALDQEQRDSRIKLEQRVTDLETQIVQLRAIVTQHDKEQPPPMRVARRMSEVRNHLKQGDEDAL